MPTRYERALGRTDTQCRARAQKHLILGDGNSLDALCPAAAAATMAVAAEKSRAERAPFGAPTPNHKLARDERLLVVGAGGRQPSPALGRGTKGHRHAGRAAGARAAGADPRRVASSTPVRGNGAGGAEPEPDAASSGEWSAVVRSKPRRRTGPSRRSAEAAAGRDSITPPPEGELVQPRELGSRHRHRHPAPAPLQLGTGSPAPDDASSSSGEWASLAEVKRKIDLDCRHTRNGEFSPPVTPASELHEGCEEDLNTAEQAEWRDSAACLPKRLGAGSRGSSRGSVEWQTDVVDVQAEINSLSSLPFSLEDLKLDGSVGSSTDEWQSVAEDTERLRA